ncbi:lysoplasmalogenase [Silanimonas sp.]|jgi:uncharacterized membrane protein YhhN|uniref:lysoplasmalogenase n=1 Tax=Silanimonas sp. TaxID=1929290 RepID=UPI0037C7873A
MLRDRQWRGWIAASAVLAIAGALSAPAGLGLHYVFKPVTTLLLIAFAWRSEDPHGLRPGVITGLLLSLLGDVALMLPIDAFVVGLGAFLLAHLAYIVAFFRHCRLKAVALAWLGYGLLAAGVLSLLLPQVPEAMRGAVVAYVVVLTGMAAFAFGARERAGSRLAVGGALFVLSDGLLAWDRFASAVPLASLWVLSTYWAAQWCIARSIAAEARRG